MNDVCIGHFVWNDRSLRTPRSAIMERKTLRAILSAQEYIIYCSDDLWSRHEEIPSRQYDLITHHDEILPRQDEMQIYLIKTIFTSSWRMFHRIDEISDDRDEICHDEI